MTIPPHKNSSFFSVVFFYLERHRNYIILCKSVRYILHRKPSRIIIFLPLTHLIWGRRNTLSSPTPLYSPSWHHPLLSLTYQTLQNKFIYVSEKHIKIRGIAKKNDHGHTDTKTDLNNN